MAIRHKRTLHARKEQLPEPNYVLQRLRCDSRYVRDLATQVGAVGHPGVTGRLRELLVNNILRPWLPPLLRCGTGIIIDHRQQIASAGQDDIILFDSRLSPAVISSSEALDGVYFFDSVLCRIEVKSKLTRTGLASFVGTSRTVSKLELVSKTDPKVFGALNFLIAFSSEVAAGKELHHLCEEMSKCGIDPLSGIVSSICIAGKGFWTLAEDEGKRGWKQLVFDDPADPLAYFVGFVSNSCFAQSAARQRIEPLGGGIGTYLDHPFEWV